MTPAASAGSTTVASVPRPRIRYRSLDTWRGVACLMVLVFHAAYYQFAALRGASYSLPKIIFSTIGLLWIGVPVFFVISGYCITATCESSRTRIAGIRSYFYRRYRRIFPPFWAILALTAVAVTAATALNAAWLYVDNEHAIPFPWGMSASQWLGNLTLTESWRYIVGGDRQLYFLNPAWSLCYEEQFYLVCGALLFLAPGRFFRGVMAISAFVVVIMGLTRWQGWTTAGFFFDGRWLLFGGGILVYWLIHRASAHSRRIVTNGLIAASFLCATAWFAPYVKSVLRANLGVAIEASVALWFSTALVLLHRYDEQIYASRLLWPVTWCGTMCYSVYLVHWPVVKPISKFMWEAGANTWVTTLLLTLPVCLVASIALARGFFLLVERRFLNPAGEPVVAASGAALRPEPARVCAGGD